MDLFNSEIIVKSSAKTIYSDNAVINKGLEIIHPISAHNFAQLIAKI